MHVHQFSADSVSRGLAFRPVGHRADALLVRPRRCVRGTELRIGRGGENSANGTAACAVGLRGEVLGQDRQRAAVADDFRGRRVCDRAVACGGGFPPDIEFMQTYAGGPVSQANSILWPNPAFANNITVYGPEVKALAGRYLRQMLDDIRALPDPDGVAQSLLAASNSIVPHQANKTMVDRTRDCRRCVTRPAVLQHRPSRKHIVGQHSARHSRRCPRRRDHQAHKRLRARIRRRRGRRLRGSANRPRRDRRHESASTDGSDAIHEPLATPAGSDVVLAFG